MKWRKGDKVYVVSHAEAPAMYIGRVDVVQDEYIEIDVGGLKHILYPSFHGYKLTLHRTAQEAIQAMEETRWS